MALARHGLVVWGSLSLSLGACATMTPEESALRELIWGAATECARATSNITVTDVDSYGRVWYSMAQGGKQDEPVFTACFHTRSQAELAKQPALLEYVRKRQGQP
jgi:hypothetical protein